ncbi:unnamed protein product [Brassica oleracea]
MDCSGPREGGGGGGVMKPVILEVGVALVISNWFDFGQMVSEEDYRSVLEECVDLKKDVANGVKEVINLRWT